MLRGDGVWVWGADSVLEEASVMIRPQCTQRHGAVPLGSRWESFVSHHTLPVFICLTVSQLQHTGSLAVAYGTYFPDQGSNLGPLHWELGDLATGQPGKPHSSTFCLWTCLF